MKYIEKGYKKIENGFFIKTYEPYDDGTLATDKQKTAIKNLKSYMESGVKTNHKCLSKSELKRVEKLTKVQAMLEIDELIKDVENYDNERNSWDFPL